MFTVIYLPAGRDWFKLLRAAPKTLVSPKYGQHTCSALVCSSPVLISLYLVIFLKQNEHICSRLPLQMCFVLHLEHLISSFFSVYVCLSVYNTFSNVHGPGHNLLHTDVFTLVTGQIVKQRSTAGILYHKTHTHIHIIQIKMHNLLYWAVVLHITAVGCSALVLVVIEYCAIVLAVKHCITISCF